MNGLSGVSRKYDGAGDFAPRSCAGWRWAQLPPLRGSGVYTGVDRLSVFLEDVGSRQGVRVQRDGRGRASGFGAPRPVPRRYRAAPAPSMTIATSRSRPPQGQCRTWISKALSISAAPRPRNSSFWRGTRESDRCSSVVAGEASGRSRQRPGYRSGQGVLRPGRLLRGPWHGRPALRGTSRGSAAGAGLKPRGGRRAESRSAQCRLSRPARGSSAPGTRGRRAAP